MTTIKDLEPGDHFRMADRDKYSLNGVWTVCKVCEYLDLGGQLEGHALCFYRRTSEVRTLYSNLEVKIVVV